VGTFLIKRLNSAENQLHCEQLTRENSWHECGEHEKQHAEEEASSIVVGFARLVANAEVQKTNENTDTQM